MSEWNRSEFALHQSGGGGPELGRELCEERDQKKAADPAPASGFGDAPGCEEDGGRGHQPRQTAVAGEIRLKSEQCHADSGRGGEQHRGVEALATPLQDRPHRREPERVEPQVALREMHPVSRQ